MMHWRGARDAHGVGRARRGTRAVWDRTAWDARGVGRARRATRGACARYMWDAGAWHGRARDAGRAT